VKSDVITLQAGGFGLLSNLLGVIGGVLQLDPTTIGYGKLLTGVAIAADGYSAYLDVKAVAVANPSIEPAILNFLNKAVASVQAELTQIESNTTAQNLLGPGYATLISTASSTITAISNLINSNVNDPNFASYVTAVQNIAATVQSLLTNLGGSSGAGSQTVTQSDYGGSINISNTLAASSGGTFSLNGSQGVDPQTGSVDISSFLMTQNGYILADAALSPSDALKSTIALTGAGGDADEFDDLNANATLGESLVFNGLTVQAPDSASFTYGTAANDALMLVIAPPDNPNTVTIDNSVGYDQVLLNGQQLFNYLPEYDDLGNPQLDISLSSSGSFDITAALGSDDSGTVNDDTNVAGVVQNFQFGEPNDILAIYNPASFYGTISNFQAGDILYLVGATTNDGVTNLSATSGGQLLVPE